jgi:hypothetical protein
LAGTSWAHFHPPPRVFDKTLLFEMSYALMRRFAFIEVSSPDDPIFEELIEGWAGGPGDADPELPVCPTEGQTG